MNDNLESIDKSDKKKGTVQRNETGNEDSAATSPGESKEKQILWRSSWWSNRLSAPLCVMMLMIFEILMAAVLYLNSLAIKNTREWLYIGFFRIYSKLFAELNSTFAFDITLYIFMDYI